MNNKIFSIFYGADGLPYKDATRSVHYPITGNSFIGTNNTKTIRFYVKELGGTDGISWVVVSKLPNGKVGYEPVTSVGTDTELNEKYLSFDLSSYYTTVKGDLYLALRGYQGEITFTEGEDNVYEINGDPLIEVTGTIKFAINYSPMINTGTQVLPSDVDKILDALGNYIKNGDGIVVIESTSSDVTKYEEGQIFYSIAQQNFYRMDDIGQLYVYTDIWTYIQYFTAQNYTKKFPASATSGLTSSSTLADLYAIIGYEPCFVQLSLPVVGNWALCRIEEGLNGYYRFEFEFLESISRYYGIANGSTTLLTLFSANGPYFKPYATEEYVDNNFLPIIENHNMALTLGGLSDLVGLNKVCVLKRLRNSYICRISQTNPNKFEFEIEGMVDISRWEGYDVDGGTILNDILTVNSVYYKPYAEKEYVDSELASGLATKQDTLVSGTNIKTINNLTLLGSGNINIQGGSGGGSWGEITGDIDDQTDLQQEFQEVREIAEGKTASYTLSYSTTGNSAFNSQNASISIASFVDSAGNTISYEDLRVGDVILVVETDVPDRWVQSVDTENQVAVLYKLETTKVDLDDYYTKSQADTLLADKADESIIANEYNNTIGYALGDYCIYQGVLYRCTTAITTAEEWNSSHWTEVKVSSEFATNDKVVPIKKTSDSDFGSTLFKSAIQIDGTLIDLINPMLFSNNSNYNRGFYVGTKKNLNGTDEYRFGLYNRNASTGVVSNFKTLLNYHGGLSTAIFYIDKINPNSSNYGLIPPNTTNYTANKEIATTDQAFNVINAVDIVDNTLTQAQYDLITNGKPTLIKGILTISSNSFINSFVLLTNVDGSSQSEITALFIGYITNNNCVARTLVINTSLKVISLRPNVPIRISQGGQLSIYEKAFPSYPTTNTNPQALTIGASGGSLSWSNIVPTNAYATNSTTTLQYETINNISVSANTTFTLATAPSNTYPEYKANITNTDTSNSITITLPVGTIVKAESGITVSSNTFDIPADTTIILSVQDNLALVMIKG